MHIEFLGSAAHAKSFPASTHPEFAFVGRSNCGKSSLLNAVANTRGAARSSATPGRTALIQFFKLNGKVILADLPGYGYSATGKKIRHQWPQLMANYFKRPNIAGVFYLQDIRRSLQGDDLDLLHFLAAHNKVFYLVMTKIDKVNKVEQRKQLEFIQASLQSLGLCPQKSFLCSALKKEGVEALRELLLQVNDLSSLS